VPVAVLAKLGLDTDAFLTELPPLSELAEGLEAMLG